MSPFPRGHPAFFRDLADLSPEPMAVHFEDKLVYVNEAAARLLGWSREELLGVSRFDLTHPDDRTPTGEGEGLRDVRLLTRSGGTIEVGIRTSRIPYRGKTAVQVVATETAARREWERRWRESREWLAAVLRIVGEGIVGTDREGKVAFLNPAAESLSHWQESEVLGRGVEERFPTLQEDTGVSVEHPVVRAMRERKDVARESRTGFVRRDGEEIPIEGQAAPVLNGNGEAVGVVWAFRDLLERRSGEEKMRYGAFHDEWTGLPNRRLFRDLLSMALIKARRSRERLAVLFLDLDHFKLVNDSLGYETGNAMLKQVSFRLEQAVREWDTVARSGGDEFMVLLENIEQEAGTALAKRVMDRLTAKFVVQGHSLYTSASIGISCYPDHGDDSDTLIQKAEIAAGFAKSNGKNAYRYFTPDMESGTVRRMELAMGLREALAGGGFLLDYRVRAGGGDGQVAQVETKIRWRHPSLGEVSPAEFLPVAEAAGLHGAIGEWFLRSACTQCRDWQEDGSPPMRMVVNLRMLPFGKPNFALWVGRILEEAGLAADRLELELSADAAVDEDAFRKLEELRALGIHVALP